MTKAKLIQYFQPSGMHIPTSHVNDDILETAFVSHTHIYVCMSSVSTDSEVYYVY